MEITVLDVTNPPTKPVLAIHAGSVRRQAKLEVNQPFVIPHPGSQTGPVEVSLFQQLASHVLPSDNTPEVFCNIPVKTPNGQSSQVQLRVRRGEAAHADKLQKTDDSMGVTRDYLDHHQLQQRIQSLIQDVLREQPDNPYKYMLQQLRKTKGANRAEKQESEPLVPRAPEGPKPDGSRPVAGGRMSAAKRSSSKEDRKIASFGEDTKIEISLNSKPAGEYAEAHAAARFSVTALLRMPRCKTAAEQSLRNSARVATAESMCGLVVSSVKEKITAEVAKPPVPVDFRGLTRASINLVIGNAATLLSPEYHKAVSGWARYIAYRGAGRILGQDMSSQARRCSMPTPIVFLAGEGGAWGSWLSSSPSKDSSKLK